MFFKGSRYAKVPEQIGKDASGRTVRYKTTRFIPETPAISGHLVTNGERLDQIAWQHLRDAQRFWRVCDANRAMQPEDILEEAAVIKIPAPEA